jgi:SAM-dependent methyltransferase
VSKPSNSKLLRSAQTVLANPAVYDLWWKMVGGPAWARGFVEQYVRPKAGARILDIGCGPGTMAGYLPNSQYVGFDLSPSYIALARKRHPNFEFVCERVSGFSLAGRPGFDIVLAVGIVHHLDDQEARQLFQIAYDALESGGKLITFDGVWTEEQSRAARWMLARDRGEHVRNESEYVNIARGVFGNIQATVRHDLIRIPYSHLILECVR